MYRCRTVCGVTPNDLRQQVLVFPNHETPYIALSGGRRVRQRFTALVQRPPTPFSLGVFVEPDGSGVCTSLGCVAEVDGEQPWITDVMANLPDMGLRAWVRFVVTYAAKLEEAPDPAQWPAVPVDLDEESPARQHWREIAEAWHNQPTRRRKVTTPARLREVATLYNSALAEGRHDPTVAVAEGMHLSRSQAAKLVTQCRRSTPPMLPPIQRSRKDHP